LGCLAENVENDFRERIFFSNVCVANTV